MRINRKRLLGSELKRLEMKTQYAFILVIIHLKWISIYEIVPDRNWLLGYALPTVDEHKYTQLKC